jgi:preprotein translocase subunit SecD
MRALILFLLLLTSSNLQAQQTVQLHFVCGEAKADCISMKTFDGKDMLVEKSPVMEWTSDDVVDIRSVKGDYGQPAILLSLSGEAAKRFADLTRANLHRQLAITADGKIMTAPTINAPIERGPLQIAAGASLTESPLLRVPWVKTRLEAEKTAAASTLKAKMAVYIILGLLLLFGALYFVFFRTKEQPRSES